MNLLVIRMSAMGDVALSLPALTAVLDAYPELTITLVTQKQFLPFFDKTPRLRCVAADIRGVHRGIPGLWRLYREIREAYDPAACIDLHDVLRSHILSFFFRMAGKPVYRIDKGRREKKQLTSRRRKRLRPLPHTVDRYLATFKKAGFPARMPARGNWFNAVGSPDSLLAENRLLPKTRPWVGVAPFARHREKRWPLEKMEVLIESLIKAGTRVFLFGGGAEETTQLRALAHTYRGAVVVAGALSLSDELGLIARLDVMVTMDSANMHLAALSGIPVVSVWGATHPYAGFGPLGDNTHRIVQVSTDTLDCRPCSVFGNKPCFRGDHACMGWIAPGDVLSKVSEAIDEAATAG